MKRAERRHHRRRMRTRAERLVRAWGFAHDEEHVLKQTRLRGDNFTVCSCAACGNPRNNGWSDGSTMQELRAPREDEEYE